MGKKRPTNKTLIQYLKVYSKMQKEIILCYRPTNEKGWGDRCLYLDNDYDQYKAYNHRSILEHEIVIEFDEEDPQENKRLIEQVVKKLHDDNIVYSLWASGNKSFHLHFFIEPKRAKNLSLLKNVIIRYYSEGLDKLPDLRLTSKHLIRAEHGIHEKTGVKKHKIRELLGYPRKYTIKAQLWERYIKEQERRVSQRMSTSINDLSSSSLVKYLLDTVKMREELGDGRERILWVLVHVLKPKHDKQELKRLLTEWYRYSGGTKLTEYQVECKINYHYHKEYNITELYLVDLLMELGVSLDDVNKIRSNPLIEKNETKTEVTGEKDELRKHTNQNDR